VRPHHFDQSGKIPAESAVQRPGAPTSSSAREWKVNGKAGTSARCPPGSADVSSAREWKANEKAGTSSRCPPGSADVSSAREWKVNEKAGTSDRCPPGSADVSSAREWKVNGKAGTSARCPPGSADVSSAREWNANGKAGTSSRCPPILQATGTSPAPDADEDVSAPSRRLVGTRMESQRESRNVLSLSTHSPGDGDVTRPRCRRGRQRSRPTRTSALPADGDVSAPGRRGRFHQFPECE